MHKNRIRQPLSSNTVEYYIFLTLILNLWAFKVSFLAIMIFYIKWVNYRPMQKNMAEWRTPQMVDGIGGITQGMVSAFNEYIGGVHPVMSSGGSNGAADTLTNWDGSEVTNGWRAPARPNFLGYSKKKGGGIGY